MSQLQVVEQTETKVDYEPQLLSTKELIDRYWAQCVPHIEGCLERMHGEMTVEDLYTRALQGQVFIIAVKNDETEIPDVKLTLVLEIVEYPRYSALNVVILGGRDLRHLMKKFWKDVLGWARICGVKKVECSVHPAMEKILLSAGFERHYVQLRQDLTEV